MKQRYLFILGFCILLTVAVALRGSRAERGMFLVTESQVDGNQMVTEYRMSHPFEVSLQHEVRKPMDSAESRGIHVSSYTPLRTDKLEFIESKYDILRGEYYVRLRLQQGLSLMIDANGHHLEFAAWYAPDARNVQWIPSGLGVQYGDGVGIDLLLFAKSTEQEEFLTLHAGVDLKHAAQ